MKGRHVWHVFHKEMLDMLRDRKTWIGTFLIPIVAIPFVFFVLGSSLNRVQEEAREHVPMAVIGDPSHPLAQRVFAAPGAERVQALDPIGQLRAGKVRAVFVIPPGADRTWAAGGTVRITVWYDPSNSKSVYARQVVEEAAARYGQEIVEQRLRRAGLSPEAVHPVVVRAESAVPPTQVAGGMLASIIPLMLVVSLAAGGIPAATDLVAGERERGTLEPLLVTPVPSASILTAKLLAVMAMNLASGLASMASTTAILFWLNRPPEPLGAVSPGGIMTLLLAAILLSAMFAGMQLLLSTAARSFKEAQLYMPPLVLIGTVPAYLLMPLHPTDIPPWYYVLPVCSEASLLKEVFFGAQNLLHVALAAGSSLVYIAAVVAVTARLFRRERPAV